MQTPPLQIPVAERPIDVPNVIDIRTAVLRRRFRTSDAVAQLLADLAFGQGAPQIGATVREAAHG